MIRQPLPRRTFLRGLGTVMALPLLEAMTPLSAFAQTSHRRPTRMAFISVPNGVNMDFWRPGPEGALGPLPETLAPLEPLKDRLTVLTGLTQKNAFALGDGPGDHARSSAAWLTGVHPKKTDGTDIRCGISVDQLAAAHVGKQTRFASLELGCERGALAGNCDSGYSCAYSSSISWKTENTPVAKEVNPRLVFERLFGSGDRAEESARIRSRRSVLDFVIEDAAALQGQLGGRDARKIDEYFAGVRDIERRLTALEQEEPPQPAGATRPDGIPQDYGQHLRLMGDMMVLAFQADLTRVCTFMFANEGSNRNYRQIGVSDGHHDISHHGRDDKKLDAKKRIDRYHVEQLAYILNRMRTIEEGNATLLDNSMIVYGSGISDGDRHNHDDLPLLLAGGGAGTLKTGRHLVYPNGTPMANLFLSMLDRMGVREDKFGDSTGQLERLF
ncbi:MAG: DUF1552 domain-containing protein [Fimbriimonadaceae bacterium]|nr:DUF1552 domain-containing protein [Fimbriimonadaceae bacterium]